MNYLNKFIPFKRRTFFLLKNSLFFALFFIVLSFCETTQAANKTLNLVVGKYECTKNADCAGEDMYCDIDKHVCRNQCTEKATYQCHNNSDCSGEEAFCDVDDHVCKQWPKKCYPEVCALKEVCENVLDECDENQHFLDGHCVECVSNADCTTAEKPFCNTDGFVCDSCPTDRPYWYAGLHICVGCLNDSHCPDEDTFCRTTDFSCQTCYDMYGEDKPVWNGSTCISCREQDEFKPIWDGSKCVSCAEKDASKPIWDGSKCIVCSQNDDCVDPQAPFCRATDNDGLGLCTCPDKSQYDEDYGTCVYKFWLEYHKSSDAYGIRKTWYGGASGGELDTPMMEASYTMIFPVGTKTVDDRLEIYRNGTHVAEWKDDDGGSFRFSKGDAFSISLKNRGENACYAHTWIILKFNKD